MFVACAKLRKGAGLLTQGQIRWSVRRFAAMPHASFSTSFFTALAASLMAGEQTPDAIIERLTRTLGRPWPWIPLLASQYLAKFAIPTPPRRRDVAGFLRRDEGLRSALNEHPGQIRIEHWLPDPPRMHPATAARDWSLPILESIGALADWLEITPSEADWFADLKGLGLGKNGGRLHHYHYNLRSTRNGDIRVIEAPKHRLKRLQRQILSRILEQIPIHSAAHGFRKGRSIQTFAQPHVRRDVVLRMDLQDFFPSFTGPRIQAFFRTAGYPEPVADLLGGICTNIVPLHIWKGAASEFDLRRIQQARVAYSRPHLPQGAATSPALANACSYRMDSRLSGLARAAGVEYTRYADDLAFSGDGAFKQNVERFSTHVAALLAEEGFHVHHRKTRIMRQGVRQYLAGLVTNQRVNVPRPDFDRLKALLTNCVRHGPHTQNREHHPAFRAHLEGRIAFLQGIHAEKATRLRAIFDRIQWE